MLTIGYRFIAGHYHATPWGRHVNEGETEWPPSPWRLLRALLAVWHARAADSVDPETMRALIHRLASEWPAYYLPPSAPWHTRHYMPSRDGRYDKATLIFDAARRIDPRHWLMVSWPTVTLTPVESRALDTLLSGFGYLGRAESWVEAARVEAPSSPPTCRPLQDNRIAGLDSVTTPLLVPLNESEYQAWRESAIARQAPSPGGARRRGRARQVAEIPDDLVAALEANTSQLIRDGWSQPPGSRWVLYEADPDPSPTRPNGRTTMPASGVKPTTIRLALTGRPLPRVFDTVLIGETMRRALLAQVGRLGPVPPALTGRTPDGRPRVDGHRHAFFLPEDADGDGFIDHIVLHAVDGLEPVILRAVDRLRKLYTERGLYEWGVIVEGIGPRQAFEQVSPLLASSRIWVSRTPYLHPWHQKRNGSNGPDAQLARELRERHWPLPAHVEPLGELSVRGRPLRPLEFRRFRTGSAGPAADRLGSFWRLEFSEPVAGPLALGYGCHYGLGLFAAVRSIEESW